MKFPPKWSQAILLKDFLTALSLSNLCFISGWQMLLVRHASNYPFYHWKVHPGPLYLAIVLDVLLLAGLFWGGMVLARRSANHYFLTAAKYVFVLTLLLPLFHLLSYIRFVRDGTVIWALVVSGLIIGGGLLFFLIYRRNASIKLAARLVLILSPLVGIWFFQAIKLWVGSPRSRETKVANVGSQRSGAPQGRRVLWLVLDELDFRLTFVERPPFLQLPEFDKLRREALFASNAYPPAGDTVLSLPALITGRLVAKAERTSYDELMLTIGDGDRTVPWSRESSVFTEARSAGYRTGLVGWYHPYCRVLGTSLDVCYWETAGIMNLQDSETVRLISSEGERDLRSSMLSLVRRAMWTIPPLARFQTPKSELWRRYQTAEFSRLREQTIRMAADPELGMVVAHLPIPHPMGIYDRSTQSFSLDPKSDYFDNLALADRLLGELRQELERVELWDRTTILVTSDHWLRAERVWRKNYVWNYSVAAGHNEALLSGETDHRVPFLLKLAGQREGLSYEPPFNSVLSRDLSIAILRGEISTPGGAVNWLEEHRTIGESPYVEGEK